jgi:hypothetical protein
MYRVLDHICDTNQFDVLISGTARGADQMGEEWAVATVNPIEVWRYPADWKKHGRSAGFKRNVLMLEHGKPDLVVAFLEGASRGTHHTIREAQARDIPVVEVRQEFIEPSEFDPRMN